MTTDESPIILSQRYCLGSIRLLLSMLALVCPWFYHEAIALEPVEPLRAVIPKAQPTPLIDGNLEEYDNALCTPIEYFHADSRNRPAQFYYLWDEQAIYVGVRTLDEKPFAPDELFWIGDAVEWYFDTRAATIAERRSWGPGAVHCFFTPLRRDQVAPRFSLRPGYEDAIPEIGIEVAAKQRDFGLEYEFKLPWSNFPEFKPLAGASLHLDAELSFSDGVSRSFRSFVFGGPLSVEQPANLASAVLVDQFQTSHWRDCGPVMMPMRVDVAWQQDSTPQVEAMIAMPPNRMTDVGKVVFRLLNTSGDTIAEHLADKEEILDASGKFIRRTSNWPVSIAAPGSYHIQAIVYDQHDKELVRVAPRLVSFNMVQGY